jgi:hypothetical protein
MPKRFMTLVLSAVVAPTLSSAPLAQRAHAQASGTVQNQKAAPAELWNTRSIEPAGQKAAAGLAPRRDISGIWDAFRSGILPAGPKGVAPFTELGKRMADAYKPGDGLRKVAVGLINDPLDGCDPAGFPRNLLFELRPFRVVQTPNQVLMLYEYQKVWRVIWTDGRKLPEDPEPRWYGYSVGHWEDDYTFVVNTFGMDERTWLDNAGDPHSAEMRVEEHYHRVNRETLELTVKIDDPKVYMYPWTGRDKLALKLQPPTFDIREMICAPSEAEEYKKQIAEPATK